MQLDTILRNLAQVNFVKPLVTWFISKYLQLNPDIAAVVRREFHINMVVDEKTRLLLDEIPTETKLDERFFLYWFFRNIWDGQTDVVEIGPFLGGSTRSIALGMLANARRNKNARLYTYDRFDDYYPADRLKAIVRPLLDSGKLRGHEFVSSQSPRRFKEIFDSIHDGQVYTPLIKSFSAELPDSPDDTSLIDNLLTLPDHVQSGAIFIDGCKSWFGTKWFMKESAKVTTIGSYLIFQDYGWYTCFWLAAFLKIMEENFELLGSVHDTYIFSLVESLDADDIEAKFPNEPETLGESKLVEIFDQLIYESGNRNDPYATCRHAMHKAAAVAYLGNSDLSKTILRDLLKSRISAGHEKYIKEAIVSPTYRPTGAVLLND